MIGILATSGGTAVLAYFGAVHLELVRNHEDLQAAVESLRHERGQLESERDKLRRGVDQVSQELRKLKDDQDKRTKMLAVLDKDVGEAESRQKDLREKNQQATRELGQLEKTIAANRESLQQLPLFKELVQVLKSKAGSDSRLRMKIDEYPSNRKVKNTTIVADGYESWYA